jgi:hypothetical protein
MSPETSRASLACERLARSRERLRHAMQASAPAPAATPAILPWLEGLKVLPGFDVVLAALRAWWSQQPLRQAGMNAADLANAALLPLAQRAPLALLAGAAAIGGLVVWLRPWRWLPAAALLGAVVPNLLGKMVTQLPLQSWLAGLASMQSPRPDKPRQNDPAQAHAP